MALNRSTMSMGKRYQQQFDTKDDGGGARKSDIINWNKAPKLAWFKVKLGKMKFNILPFQIKSPNHPEVAKGTLKVGDWDYVLDIWAHQYLGPDKVTLLCPKKTYGKPCPICEEVSRLYDDGRDKDAKQLQASRRCFFNVQPMTKDGLAESPEIFHVSHFLFTKELMDEANACGDGNGVVEFANPDDGFLIECHAEEEKKGDNPNPITVFKSFKFLDRDEEISDEVLEKCISFDKFLVVPSTDDLTAAMYGMPAENKGEDRTPSRGAVALERRKTTTATEKTSEPHDGGNSPERTTRNRPSRQEDMPPPPPPAEDVVVDCPRGYEFGKDLDTKSGCSKCPDAVYEACRKAQRGK